MSNDQTTRKGVLLALTTAIVSGVAIFVNKYAVGAITPPLVFTATKNFGVGLMVLAFILSSGKISQIRKLNKNEMMKLLAIGVVGGAIPFYLFFTGLSQIPAINGAIIHKTLVLWVAVLTIPFLKEKLSLMQIGAIAVVVWMNLGIGGFAGFKFSTGELMVLVATMLWAVENVIAKKVLKSVDPDLVVGARMGFGSLLLMSAALWQYPEKVMGIVNLNSTQWMWMLASMITLGLYVISWYRALKYAPATLVTTVLVLATVVTNALSAVFVTRVWSMEMMTQAAVMLVAAAVFVLAGVKIEPDKKETLSESRD